MSEKSNYINFGDSVIDMSEIAYYDKKVSGGTVTLLFVLRSGFQSANVFSGEGLYLVEQIERALYGFWQMKVPSEMKAAAGK
jgi:hypothetical protein